MREDALRSYSGYKKNNYFGFFYKKNKVTDLYHVNNSIDSKVDLKSKLYNRYRRRKVKKDQMDCTLSVLVSPLYLLD